MKKLTYSLLAILFLTNCGNPIKNEEATVHVEEGTVADSTNDQENITEEIDENTELIEETDQTELILPSEPSEKSDYIGYWVGYFLNAEDNAYEKDIYADEGFWWNRANKINISIEYIKDSLVIGRSIVAGNNRPFEGTYTTGSDGAHFHVKEPGDDKYDGEFTFDIINNELKGKWQAYKNIDIAKRKYTLDKREFEYDPTIMLEQKQAYIDWQNYTEESGVEELGDNDFEEWVRREFATATPAIYEINASTTKLKEEDVENLMKGDLVVIRNTIYARHGYSFKNRPLRVFFDRQDWYIPVSTNIKKDFTDLEKENIKLLLKYEKNAAEYYDYFGRG